MSAMARRLGTAMLAGLLALAGAAGCGGSDTPPSTRTTTVSPSTTEAPSPTPESVLTSPTVVVVRGLPDGSQVLVAYDLDDGTTRQLATLAREEHPTLDAAGTSVVVEQYTGTADPQPLDVQSGGASHLVLIDLATGSRRGLTASTEGVFDHAAVWNRFGDGWVYFLRSGPAVPSGGLWRVSPRTGEVQQAPHGPGVSQFVLEPGGRSAWVQGGWGVGGAYRLDLATGGVARHPFDPAVGGDLAWSPDGTWLAYTENGCGVPTCPELLIRQWPDGKARTLLTMPPVDGTTATWHVFGQVGWDPDGSAVILQETRFSWNTADQTEPTLLEQRILLVNIADGSTTPIGPATVNDQSFEVWDPPAD
jgi:hypothetical protein